MMEVFTKGPWRYSDDDGIIYGEESTNDGIICDMLPTGDAEHDANAALIAAAPEMYEMLKRFADNNVVFPLNMRNDMHAILAKARGEQ